MLLLCLLQTRSFFINPLFRLHQICIMVLTKFVKHAQNMGIRVCQLELIESGDSSWKISDFILKPIYILKVELLG